MSLGGRNFSPSVIEYGPDGTIYNNPADAAAAGVNNATRSTPMGVPYNQYVPMRVPAPQPYTLPYGQQPMPAVMPYGRKAMPAVMPDGYGQQPMPAVMPDDRQPMTAVMPDGEQAYTQGGVYAQPYTPAVLPNIPTQSSGGRNLYAEIMANYQQAQPIVPPSYSGGFLGYPSNYTGGFTPYQRPAPAPAVEQDQYAGLIQQIGGNSGGGYSNSPAGQAEREKERTPEQKAMQLNINRGIASLIDSTGKISPIAVGLKALFGSSRERGDSQGAGAFPGGSGPPPSGERGGSQVGGGYGGGAATGGRDGDASGGGDRGTRGGFAQGGHVSMQHLGGPDPEGPDDGYAALKDGEFVINDKAVKKYGIELMNAINSGKISKGKLRGLLEM